jgi:4-aminobutyrate--pyruvate transaminase
VDKYARKHGLITRFVGDRIAFSPPLIITKAEIDEAVDKITLAINETWAEIRA